MAKTGHGDGGQDPATATGYLPCMGDRTTTATGKLDDSEALDHGVRLGLVVYGIVHLIIAFTALDLAWGRGDSGTASQQGALSQMASTPLGKGVLYVVAVGFAALVVWQAAEAAVGYRQSRGKKRTLKRLGAAGKTVVYAVLAFSAARKAASAGSGGGSTDSMTAQVMAAPLGQLLVGLVGLGVIAVGGYLVHRGWAEKFTKSLDADAKSGNRSGVIVTLGKAGHIAKGVSLAGVGSLFLFAAVQHDPQESGGLDVALHVLLRQPFGPVLLSAVALGFACFGLFCLAWARHLDR